MTVEYTSEQVLALAPDAGSQKSGQDLANTRKWRTIAMDDAAIWGECQGSGGSPYQTRVDLNGPAFKCSCPSRKFPCKHGIGLLLLYSLSRVSFNQAKQPAWVSDWLASRHNKQKKEKTEDTRTPEQLEEAKLAKEKRRAGRMESVSAGVEELELFLCDLIRQGVGHLKTEGYAYFETRAARLIDAQAPGLARLVRECASLTASQTNWQEPLLNRIATIFLIARAFRNLDRLPPLMQQDVLAAVGFTQSQENLLSENGISDLWCVVGQYVYSEDRLRVQKSWLYGGKSKRTALILSFAHGMAPFDVTLIPGHFYDAELVFYPSSYPLRALIKNKNSESQATMPEGFTSIESALDQYAQALTNIPWLEEVPILLSGQKVVPNFERNKKMFLTDENGSALPLATKESNAWQLLAFSSGQALSIFGEYDGVSLTPLAALSAGGDRYLRLATGEY